MKFNGEIWMRIPVTQKQKGEPDEFVIVKNPKFAGGLIPYARFGNEWTTTVPNRPLIRELCLIIENGRRTNGFLISCSNCEIKFVVSTGFREQKLKDLTPYYCPNGCQLTYRLTEAD